MNNGYSWKTMESVAVVSFAIAICMAIIYLMNLPIFNRADLAWVFIYGLTAAAVAVSTIIIRAIWSN